MIALDPYYDRDADVLVVCPFCGGQSDCGTGHHAPYYARARPTYFYSSPAPPPEPKEHRFRASALGRRYIPAPLDVAAAPLIEVEEPWRRPESFARPVRARRAARSRAIAPLRSRPGRRRRRARPS